MKAKISSSLALLLIPVIGYAQSAAESNPPVAVVDSFVRAWNSHDTNALEQLFIEDAYLVQNVGSRIEGRSNIVADFAKAFETSKKQTTIEASDVVVRSLRPDVAAILFRTRFVGQDEPRAVIFVVEHSENWRIAALQLTKPALPHPAVRLKALSEMLDQKLITTEEYERTRRTLLDQIALTSD